MNLFFHPYTPNQEGSYTKPIIVIEVNTGFGYLYYEVLHSWRSNILHTEYAKLGTILKDPHIRDVSNNLKSGICLQKIARPDLTKYSLLQLMNDTEEQRSTYAGFLHMQIEKILEKMPLGGERSERVIFDYSEVN